MQGSAKSLSTMTKVTSVDMALAYFGADEDDVMNNIFNHYAVSVTNAAG